MQAAPRSIDPAQTYRVRFLPILIHFVTVSLLISFSSIPPSFPVHVNLHPLQGTQHINLSFIYKLCNVSEFALALRTLASV